MIYAIIICQFRFIGGYLQYLPLKTKVTLKSPLEGQKLDPYHKPEEFLDRTVANLQVSAGWEANVQGNIISFSQYFLFTYYQLE